MKANATVSRDFRFARIAALAPIATSATTRVKPRTLEFGKAILERIFAENFRMSPRVRLLGTPGESGSKKR